MFLIAVCAERATSFVHYAGQLEGKGLYSHYSLAARHDEG